KTSSQTDHEIYLATKRLARVTVSRAKRNYYKDIYDSLDTADGKNEVYRLARSRQAATADIKQVRYVKDKNERILYEPQAVCSRWREHFSSVANVEFPHPPIPRGLPVAGPITPITEEEVLLFWFTQHYTQLRLARLVAQTTSRLWHGVWQVFQGSPP